MRSAQDKFNKYLDECRETSDAIREFINASHECYGNYGYAAGAFQSIVEDIIMDLPKDKRARIRERFYTLAQKHRNQALMDKIKEA